MNNTFKYNPQVHHRRSIRLKGYDYSRAGLYFITICCEKRKCRFGKIVHHEMVLNQYGIIAKNEWEKLEERFTYCRTDIFIIMPNHMHGIIALTDVVGSGCTPDPDSNDELCLENDKKENLNDKDQRAGVNPAPTDNPYFANGEPDNLNPASTGATVSDIVGAYKSITSNLCLEIFKSKNERMGKLWQRDYYEHIIRNETAYQKISAYIINNPSK